MRRNPASRRRRGNPSPPTLRELRSHPAVHQYMLFCLTALFLLVVCLADRGLEWWCLVPALIGCLTLLAHWNHGPSLVILSLAGLMGQPGPRSRALWRGLETAPQHLRFQTPSLMDLLLCLSVLAYAVGHYRLLALTRHVFPADSRYPRQGSDAEPVQRRSSALVRVGELGLLALTLPVWTGLSVLVWVWMTEDAPPLDMARDLWRILRIVWAILAGMAATGIVVSYLRLTTVSPQESLLYLQDELWRQTRREQSSLNRWLTWARLRAQRKKGT